MNKRFLCGILSIIMLLLIIPQPLCIVAATDSGTCGDNLTWTYDNGTLTVSGSGDMYDFAHINAKPWYSYEQQIHSVVIGDNVTSIGDYAFTNVRELKSLYIGNSVERIGISAFNNCTLVPELVIPDNIKTIEDHAFFGWDNTTSLTIGSGVKTIGKGAFGNWTSIVILGIPDNVTSIGDEAFANCTSLVAAKIGAGVASIGENAFNGVTGFFDHNSNSYIFEAYYVCSSAEAANITMGAGNEVLENAVSYYDYNKKIFSITYHNDGLTYTGVKREGEPIKLSPENWGCIFREYNEIGFATKGSTTVVYKRGDEYTEDKNLIIHSVYGKTSGSCGDSLQWDYNEDYTLTITGSGDMTDYTAENPSEWSVYTYIATLIIDKNVTSIGDYSFGSSYIPNIYYGGSNREWELMDKGIGNTSLASANITFGSYEYYYTLTYNANGGSGAPESVTVKGGETFNLSSAVPTRDGFEFRGWATSADSEVVTYRPCAEITLSEDTTIYALWMEILPEYTIIYDANGGIGAPERHNAVSGMLVNVSTTIPTRDGYEFLGWATSADATEAKYTAGSYISIYFDTTLYAVWKRITYTITYDANGGMGAPASQTVEQGSSTTLSRNVPIKDGCEFLGWATSSSATEAEYSPGASYTPNASITFYAVWKEVVYGVVASGSCGDNLEWTLDDGGILTISGYGDMDRYAYYYNHTPWRDYNNDIVRVILPEGITNISSCAFRGCKNLKMINIPDSVTQIGSTAFMDTSGISVYITDLSKWLAINFFDLEAAPMYGGSGSLYLNGVLCTDVQIPAGFTSFNTRAFTGCATIENVIIPNGVTSIGNHVFYKCSGLESVIIPDGVTSIGQTAFSNCTNLKSITLPNTVTNIGDYAFNECRSLESIVIPNGVTTIGQRLFYNCRGLKSVTLPETITSIGKYAFYYCTGLESITLPQGLLTIGANAFDTCWSLKSIVIPKNIKKIDANTFDSCYHLETVVLPEGLTTIADSAFYLTSELSNIYFEGSEAAWKAVTISSGNSYLTSAAKTYNSKSEIKQASCVSEGNKVTLTTDFTYLKEAGKLTVTIIDDGGSLHTFENAPASPAESSYSLEFETDTDCTGKTAKIFCWSDYDSMRPLTEAITVTIK